MINLFIILATDDIFGVWENVQKKQKLAAAGVLKDIFNNIHGDADPTLFSEEKKIALKELELQAAKLMAMCESSNENDTEEFWPEGMLSKQVD